MKAPNYNRCLFTPALLPVCMQTDGRPFTNKAAAFLFVVEHTMQQATIIFPHQLFKQHPALDASRVVYLVEETLFFRQYTFHKQKLVLHRASMKRYQQYLHINGYTVVYIDTTDERSDTRKLVPELARLGFTCIHYAEVADNWLQQRLQRQATLQQVERVVYPTPNFLNQPAATDAYFNKKKTYFQTDFYIDERRQRNLLLEPNHQPLGGKWSYDAENRARLPAHTAVPPIDYPAPDEYSQEAIAYIQQHFPGNYGSAEKLYYPADFSAAEKWLDDFLANRFSLFGTYEDAIVADEHFLFHAVLTPMLNIGLLNPQEVLDKAIDAAIRYDVPLNAVEGFIRQLIGWREFVQLVYRREGSRQRTSNYWGFSRKIPAAFYSGETGIAPVDSVIKKVLVTGYAHHIERLMVLGNFMLLCEFAPDEVYRWFMEMYADSYDWVMVPNVYGMTQFADGGLMTTKPYISGSNYLMKMGDFKKGDWQAVWDSLFWRFLHVHRHFFLTNPRMGMLVTTFDKMTTEKQQAHLRRAETYLQSLDEKNKPATLD